MVSILIDNIDDIDKSNGYVCFLALVFLALDVFDAVLPLLVAVLYNLLSFVNDMKPLKNTKVLNKRSISVKKVNVYTHALFALMKNDVVISGAAIGENIRYVISFRTSLLLIILSNLNALCKNQSEFVNILYLSKGSKFMVLINLVWKLL